MYNIVDKISRTREPKELFRPSLNHRIWHYNWKTKLSMQKGEVTILFLFRLFYNVSFLFHITIFFSLRLQNLRTNFRTNFRLDRGKLYWRRIQLLHVCFFYYKRNKFVRYSFVLRVCTSSLVNRTVDRTV